MQLHRIFFFIFYSQITFLQQETRTRADQHKYLPHLASINPTPLLYKNIIVNSENGSQIWKKLLISF